MSKDCKANFGCSECKISVENNLDLNVYYVSAQKTFKDSKKKYFEALQNYELTKTQKKTKQIEEENGYNFSTKNDDNKWVIILLMFFFLFKLFLDFKTTFNIF
jgi:hypothetical protein